MSPLWQRGPSPRTAVKICGITRQADLLEAARLGVNALGLNFFPGSPRHITHDQANDLLDNWPPKVAAVGLLVKPDQPMVERLLRSVPALGWLQFHGLTQPPDWPVPRPWIAAFAPKSELELAQLADWIKEASICPTPPSAVLVDGHAPGLEGGTGVTAPWQLLENFRPGLPWILAGGLKPGNIDQALRQTHPDAIDIASGVEERPGIKSAEKVAAVMQSISKITSQ